MIEIPDLQILDGSGDVLMTVFTPVGEINGTLDPDSGLVALGTIEAGADDTSPYFGPGSQAQLRWDPQDEMYAILCEAA